MPWTSWLFTAVKPKLRQGRWVPVISWGHWKFPGCIQGETQEEHRSLLPEPGEGGRTQLCTCWAHDTYINILSNVVSHWLWWGKNSEKYGSKKQSRGRWHTGWLISIYGCGWNYRWRWALQAACKVTFLPATCTHYIQSWVLSQLIL